MKMEIEQIGIYAIYDKKGKRYDTPFFAVNDLFARRRFYLMADEKGPLKTWPEDFRLEKVGIFDIIEGELINDNGMVIEGLTVIPKKEVNNA